MKRSMDQKQVLITISCLLVITAASSNATLTVNDAISSAQKFAPTAISKIRSLFLQEPEDPAVEGRQTVQIDRTGVQVAFGAEHIAGLLRAWLWQNCIFVLLEAVLFPILVHTYKEIFCAWGTGDCSNRYKVPKFEPESDLVFVVDKKKTLKLNKKNQMAKDRPPFKLDEGYRPLDIFPPVGDRPEPPPDFSGETTTTGASRRGDEEPTGTHNDVKGQKNQISFKDDSWATAATDFLETLTKILTTSL